MSVSWDIIGHILSLLPDPHIYFNIARKLCQRSRNIWMPRMVHWYFIIQYMHANYQLYTVSVVWNKDSSLHMKKKYLISKEINKVYKYVHNMKKYIDQISSTIYWYKKPDLGSYIGSDIVFFTQSRLYRGFGTGMRNISDLYLIGLFVQTKSGLFKQIISYKLHDGMYELIFKNPKYNVKVNFDTKLYVL
jgi:hypothetical protein